MSVDSTLSAADQTLDRARLVTIAAAITCISVAGIGLSLTAPLISLLLSAQGVSATAIGAQTSFASLAGLLTSPFVPRLARSFGLRNFQGTLEALREMARVVRPGGRLVICELSKPTWKPLRHLYSNVALRAW